MTETSRLFKRSAIKEVGIGPARLDGFAGYKPHDFCSGRRGGNQPGEIDLVAMNQMGPGCRISVSGREMSLTHIAYLAEEQGSIEA